MRRFVLPRLLMIGLVVSSPGGWSSHGWAQVPAGQKPRPAAPRPKAKQPPRADSKRSKPVPAKAATPAAAQPINVKYISADFFAASISRPRRTLSSPQFQLFPVEVTQATAKVELGINIMEVEELIVLHAFGQELSSPAWIVRFSKPYDRDALLAHVAAGEGEPVGELPSYKLKRAALGSLVCPDEQTVLVGQPAQLARMVEAEHKTSPLIEHLRTFDPSEMFSAVAVLGPVRPMIQLGMAQFPPLPPQFQPFLEAPKLLSAIEFHFGGQGTSLASIVLEGTDEGAAARLAELVEDAISLGRQILDNQLESMKAQSPGEIADATEHYAHRILKRVLAAVERKQQANRLVVSVDANFNAISIATIGALAGLLLPAVQQAREEGRRNTSLNSLHAIGLAMHNYAAEQGSFPARARFKDGKPLLSWRVAILPYLDQEDLYKQFHLDEPWDSEHNRKLIDKMPPLYGDLSNPLAGMTNYLAVAGPNTSFDGEKGPTIASFQDGTSNTIVVVESSRAVVWTRPDDLEVNAGQPLADLDLRPGGFLALFADGHTRFVSSEMDVELLLNLFNPRDGQALPNDF